MPTRVRSRCVLLSTAIGSQRRRSPSAVASEIFEPHLGSHILQRLYLPRGCYGPSGVSTGCAGALGHRNDRYVHSHSALSFAWAVGRIDSDSSARTIPYFTGRVATLPELDWHPVPVLPINKVRKLGKAPEPPGGPLALKDDLMTVDTINIILVSVLILASNDYEMMMLHSFPLRRSQLCAGAFEFSCHWVAGVFWPQVEREHMWQVEQILSVNAETGDDRTRSALKTLAMGTRTRAVSRSLCDWTSAFGSLLLSAQTLSIKPDRTSPKDLGGEKAGMGDSRRFGVLECSALIAFDGGSAEQTSGKSFYCLSIGVPSRVLIFKQ
ncbi:hypothetical protein DPX16_15344 [Anabarilius grahami]|uniref:Uncharacterized protein n=1 Tax=Anabarilius grahami TaxID=495550 RepID=A0A3N0XVR8_ANAGA|nr:hypothetical protein DPX16_15344 [Anabarilius grahami]